MSERVLVAPLELRSIAAVGAFGDQSGLLAALRNEFWVAAPEGPACVQSGGVTFCRLSPSRYLFSGQRDSDLSGRLRSVLDGLAAVTDQSDLWVGFSVSGPGAREVLARIVPVDLHPVKFSEGALALTRAGHLDVRLFRVGEDAFEIAVARSYAMDLEYLLRQAAK